MPDKYYDSVVDFITRHESRSPQNGDPLRPIEVVTLSYFAYCRTDDSGFQQHKAEQDVFNANFWALQYADEIDALDLSEDEKRIVRERLEGATGASSPALRLNQGGYLQGDMERTFTAFNPPYHPYGRRSRISKKIDDFLSEDDIPGISDCTKLRDLKESINADKDAIERLCGKGGSKPTRIDAFEKLLPLMCDLRSNPFYSSSWWENRELMKWLIDRIGQAFVDQDPHTVSRQAHDSYIRAATLSLDNYLANHLASIRGASSEAFKTAGSLDEAIQSYEKSDFSKFPSWIRLKAFLIWNIVACAVLGPFKAKPEHTMTTKSGGGVSAYGRIRGHQNGDPICLDAGMLTVDDYNTAEKRLFLLDQEKGEDQLIMVFAGRDHHPTFELQDDVAGVSINPSFDQIFNVQSSEVSYRHAIVFAKAGRLYLSDDSKNGTIVFRRGQKPEDDQCFVFCDFVGKTEYAEEFIQNNEIADDKVTIIGQEGARMMALCFGDIIILPSGQYELR